jgi:polysaccharide pyruvyl transferase CsaB
LKQFIREWSPESRIIILASNARRAYALYARSNITVGEHPLIFGRGGLRNILTGRFARLLRVMRPADVFILGGGSLLHDRSGLRSLLHVLDEIWIAKLLGRRTALYAIGVGPLRRRLARWLVALSARACDLITVRDAGSMRLLAEIGVPAGRIHLVADPALLLTARPVLPACLGLPEGAFATMKTDTVGLFLLDDMPVDRARRTQIISEIAGALDRLRDQFGWRFMFLPMMSERDDDDRIIARAIATQMQHRDAAIMIEQTFEPEEMLWLAGRFHLNIAMRLHGLLFSLAMETPALALIYDPKVANAVEDFGIGVYALTLDDITTAEVYERTARMHGSACDYLANLRARLPERRAAAERAHDLLRDLISQ